MRKVQDMKIKSQPNKKKKRRFLNGIEVEQEPQYQRLPQLNKFYRHRSIYGY